ncbi:MAG: T9SS type A sorting domain-containing protein [Saprospiraceae bacterium]|nr:T9SS type A sorting domain-containing protein [Saprospiraceae bacterium]
MNTKIRFNNHLAVKKIGMMGQLLMMLGLFLIFSGQSLYSQCLSVQKNLLAVAPASSGVPGNIDATYQLVIINTGCAISNGIVIQDILNAPGNLGSAFIRIVGFPSVAYISVASSSGNVNPGFDGLGSNPNLTDGTGFLILGDSLILQFTAEVDVDAVGAPVILNNQASTSYSIPVGHLPTMSTSATIPNCWTNCQLACNNQIQVSVNSICEADILAEMVLEGENSVCSNLGFYEVTLFYNNIKIQLPLNETYLNKKLKVNVRNIVCNNNCWGTLILEDKSPPVMNCRVRDTISCAANLSPDVLGYPVPTNLINKNVYPFIVTGLDACGIVYLTYVDSLVKYDCTNDSLSATIFRKWCARDPGGYTACCYDTIDLRRGTLADITLPPHYDGQVGNQPYLKCDGNWTKLPNGFPDTTVTGTGKPLSIYCGNIQYDFSDDTIRVCKGTFKLLRRWIILDWCNPGFRIDYIQQIKVVDDELPKVTCPANFTVSTNPWNCTGSLVLPVPQDLTPQTIVDDRTPYVIEKCSDWTYAVTHLPALDPKDCTPIPGLGDSRNITKQADGKYRVDNMPLGCNWIYYTITDGCGNSSVCQFDIEVKDLTPPVAVCQQKTVISLGSNGKALAPASVFDDRSHDNCGKVHFEVRRMNPGPCGTTSFGPDQEFCCADVSATVPVIVVLKVIDEAGNTSECMIDAFIQDKLPPKITCPKNMTVNCGTDLTNLNVFGVATATDNCQVRMETRVYNNLNTCNIGTLVREFIAIDNGSLRDSCRQTITVIDNTPFSLGDIIWPGDLVLNGCGDNPNPEITGKPIFINRDICNQPLSTYEDLTFNYVEGVCFKILRKWTVIDWCTYNQNVIPNKGVWYHTQVIKVNNTEAPFFTSSCVNQQYCITSGCEVKVTLEATASDLCTAQGELRWTYQLDLDNDGVGIITGNRNRFSFVFNVGMHRITWIVEDQCGNKSNCSYFINVSDCKFPTPYCLDGIVTVLMQNSGSVTVWAKDFNLNSEDNCTQKKDLKYSFTANIKDSFQTFTCADIPDGRSDTVEVSIYVTDIAGNQDFCKTKLILQDNQNVCPDVPTFGNLGGSIRGYNQNPSPDVAVIVKSLGNQLITKSTSTSGSYMFDDLDMYKSYTISAEYDKDPLNGISTKDIVKIQRHILGLESFDVPYKLIAADVNASGSITARDVSELRKLILGVQNVFESNTSWNFVDSNYPLSFDNYASYKNKVEVPDFANSLLNVDFISIKTGDVTGEANTGFGGNAQSRSNKMMLLELDQLDAAKSDFIKIPVRNAGDLVVASGLQMEFKIDQNDLEFAGIESGVLNINSTDYNYLKEGSIRLSWNNDTELNILNSDVLFYLLFNVKNNIVLGYNELKLNVSGLNAEVYAPSEDLGISLVYRTNNTKSDNGFELFQNVPNPFINETTIFFNVPKESFVKIGLYDLSGRIVKSYDLNAKKGLNSVKVKLEDTKMNGVLYYRLEAEEYSSTRKMIILK